MEFSLLLAGLGQGRLWSFPSQKSRDSKAAGWEFHPKNEGWQRLFSTCVGWAEDLLALKCHHFSIIHCSDERIKPWPKLGWFSRGFALQGFTEQLKLGISTFQDYLNLERQTGPPPEGRIGTSGAWKVLCLSGESQNIPNWKRPEFKEFFGNSKRLIFQTFFGMLSCSDGMKGVEQGKRLWMLFFSGSWFIFGRKQFPRKTRQHFWSLPHPARGILTS